MKHLCVECGKTAEWEEITRPEEYIVRGEKLMIASRLQRCPECGAEYEDVNSEKDPYAQAYEEYRRRKGMMHPAQIVELRKKYKLTQKELGGLLGFGDVTLSRYENGALQDEAHDQLLRFSLEAANLLRLTRQKPGMLKDEKRKRLCDQLKQEIARGYLFDEFFNIRKANIFSGNKTFNAEKLIGLIKFFTYPQAVYKSKLFKMLFYADFLAFKESQASISGLAYAHLPYGPVPDKYEFLLASIREYDPSIENEFQPTGACIGELIVSTTPASPTTLNDFEQEIARRIHSHFAHYSAARIEDYSHREAGYLETKTGEIISYAYAEKLRLK